MQIYVVRSGDSVYAIARRYGVSPDEIIYNNQLMAPFQLAVGQALLIPGQDREGEKRTIEVGGYAYPYINPYILEQTVPYLSRLLVFSYGFTAEGELLPPPQSDAPLIATALQNDAAPILTLTPLGPNGNFDNNLISSVVNDEGKKQRLIGEVVATIQEKDYRGVDIDFEYIRREDRVPFADFVRDMREAVNAIGYPVSVALAPKVSDNQRGTLYEGKDYALLGEAANHVLLMTYEWGYTYGPPMAVAPINEVRRVVEYALTRIPAEKISMGIPNYGYDWTLPFVQGTSRARNIGNVGAVQLAVENNAEIEFDERAKSPFFRYYKMGRQHEVWFEDVRSMEAKFALVEEYGLRGVGYWQVMRLFRANWLLLADTFTIDKEL